MNNVAQTRTHAITLSALPMVLAVNTCALFALEQLGGIPTWIKSAVALFLSF
jgi:hypothetical protein